MGKESLKTPFHVTYNGIQDSSVGVHVATRPAIPAAREILQTIQIPGRDGTLTIKDGTVEDIQISVEFSFSAYPDVWQDRVYAVKNWLQMRSEATLRFSDLAGIFYKVRYVELSDFTRQHKKIGTFTATFTCEGYQYLDSGLVDVSGGILSNQWGTAHPLYKITSSGSGACTLTVNGKSLQATVNANMTIDTDRAIAYRTSTGAVQNTALVMGNYDFRDFWLKPGSNTISITSGFTLQIQPNWRRL